MTALKREFVSDSNAAFVGLQKQNALCFFTNKILFCNLNMRLSAHKKKENKTKQTKKIASRGHALTRKEFDDFHRGVLKGLSEEILESYAYVPYVKTEQERQQWETEGQTYFNQVLLQTTKPLLTFVKL